MRRTWGGALSSVILIAGLTVVGGAAPGATAPARSAASERSTQVVRPVSGLYWNNPNTNSKGATNQLIQRIKDAAPNTTVRISAWSVNDSSIQSAIRGAAADGVVFKIIGSPANCDEFKARFKFLTNDRKPATWVRCVKGHGMHQKAYLFERTGGVDHVTLTGSANMASNNWAYQWNDLFQFAGPDRKEVYGWYLGRFNKIQNNLGTPDKVQYETHTAGDKRGRVNFFPINDTTPTRSQDPMWDRLNNLPTNPGGDHRTKISIAMYAMDMQRGTWLVEKLANMQAAGARIRFIAGPCVRSELKTTLRRAGISVLNGYEKGCDVDEANFVHLKAMTARYWENGEWNYRSYTGSANWNIVGLTKDFDSAHRIGGSGVYADYEHLFDVIWESFS